MGLKAALCFANSLYLKINVDYEIEVKKYKRREKISTTAKTENMCQKYTKCQTWLTNGPHK